MNRVTILSLVITMISTTAVSAQAWRDCVPGSYGPGGCESYGPGGGKSYGPGGGLSYAEGGGLSFGPGGGQSYGPSGGLSPNRDRSRGFNTETMRPFDQW